MAATSELLNKELNDFILRNEIGERYNYDAEFQYFLHKDDKLAMVVAYMKQKDRSGNEYPRFIHIIIDEKLRRSKEALKFLLGTFKDLKDKGYNKTIAVIPHWKTYMITFAEKFNFIKYTQDDKFGYWVKSLT